MTRILLTGASGFVGRQVAKALIEKGLEVTATVRKKSVLPDGLKGTIHIQDLFAEDVPFWRETLADFDVLVHAAWYTEPGKYLMSEKNLTCLAGTLAMAQGAVHASIRKFVGIGTCFEYDLCKTEGASQVPLSPHSPLGPTTTYGAAKASAWLTLSEFMKNSAVDFAWCRLFYLYGEGEDERRLVPYLRARLSAGEPVNLTKGTQIRDFMDVSEAGSFIAKAALGPHKGALNICSGHPITVADFARKISREYNREDLLQFGTRQDNLSDPPYVVGTPSLTA